jgi:peroxiredoxin
MKTRIPIGTFVCLAPLLALGQAPKESNKVKPRSITEQLEVIQKEQKERQEQLTKMLEKLQAELEQLDQQTADRYFGVVRKSPKDPAVLPALEFLVVQSTSYAGKALEIIEQHHLRSPRLGKLSLFLSEGEEGDKPGSEKFLRAILAKNTASEVVGLASLALARLLYVRAEAEGAKLVIRDAALREAEALLDSVVAKYDKVKLPEQEEDRTAGEEARPILFEIRYLATGKTVPELSGEDLNGKPMKLSVFRGKVLLLDFWAYSSGASTALIAHERQLLERMKGRPFTIVGVNGDDPDDLSALWKKTPLPWRSFRNQRKDTAADVSKEWNLKGWPTLFLIDHKGAIRRRWIAGPPAEKLLDKEVEALVRAAEEEKR